MRRCFPCRIKSFALSYAAWGRELYSFVFSDTELSECSGTDETCVVFECSDFDFCFVFIGAGVLVLFDDGEQGSKQIITFSGKTAAYRDDLRLKYVYYIRYSAGKIAYIFIYELASLLITLL